MQIIGLTGDEGAKETSQRLGTVGSEASKPWLGWG